MRIIKLSDDPKHNFETLVKVYAYFENIQREAEPNRFRIPSGKIKPNELTVGEHLVFTHKSLVVAVAIAASDVTVNNGRDASTYPCYFEVQPGSIRKMKVRARDFYELAKKMGENLGRHVWAPVRSQGAAEKLWDWISKQSTGVIAAMAQPTVEFADRRATDGSDDRDRIIREIDARRGQPAFRCALLARYREACAVTGCRIVNLLEAAHIEPYCESGQNDPEKGVLLRADIHTLFDLNLLGIEPQSLRIELHPDVANEYGSIVKQHLARPGELRPSADALVVHYTKFLAQRDRPVG